MRLLLSLSILLSACHAGAQSPAAPVLTGVHSGPSMESDPQIVAALLQLMEVKDNTRPKPSDFTDTTLKDLLGLGTPSGFHLRNRYTRLGVSLSEAVSVTEDPRLKEQMLELARWDRNPEIRAVALLAMAQRKERDHLKYFNEALINIDAGVRMAALEALEIWGLPENKAAFERIARTDLQPIIRIYAAQALLRRGDQYGREVLLRELDSGDWLAKAMAARWLGELGKGEDYQTLILRIDRESTNDFVSAEMAIAALKLFPKHSPAPAFPVTPPAAGTPGVGTGGDYELEPLVITAPRLKIPATALIDGRINAKLFQLLEDKADSRPTEEQLQDGSIRTMNELVSPNGFLLKVRYTELGFLLTEGLAGTTDLNLRNRIIKVARTGKNPQVRAAALLAIAYSRDMMDRGLFQEALLSQDITVRFGAVEALQTWGAQDSGQDIGQAARMDFSKPLQVYAAAAILRKGDQAGRDILLRMWDDPDWLVRGMAVRYLGDMGIPDDFQRILFRLSSEQNNFVKAEMCGALLKLHRLRGGK